MNCRSFWQIRHFICRNLFFFAPAYGTDRAEDMLEEIYEETGLVGSCSGYEKLPLYLADRQQYAHPMMGGMQKT